MYATQCAYWDLSDLEINRLREYLLRGGFFVADDFSARVVAIERIVGLRQLPAI